VRFVAGLEALSHVVNGGAGEPAREITVPMRDVLPEICSADLVKLDIEGGEWDILLDPRLSSILRARSCSSAIAETARSRRARARRAGACAKPV